MARLLSVSGNNTPEIKGLTPVGEITKKRRFSKHLNALSGPFAQKHTILESFDPTTEGRPILDGIPRHASEAYDIILDDMRKTFQSGSYVLHLLFRQGDPTLLDETNIDYWHKDFAGCGLAVYFVADKDPTISQIDGREIQADPYQVVRLPGDVEHRQPSAVDPHRTVAIANLLPVEGFEAFLGGFYANQQRALGHAQPVRYK